MASIRDFEHAGWQEVAAAYDGFAPATGAFIAPLLDAVGAAPGMRLLDVACGLGHVAAAAAERGAVAVGLDFSAAMVGRAGRLHPGLEFVEADAERLPFDDAAFDAVVANFGIHHVERPANAIAEARRVLRPGGRFAFTMWQAPSDNPLTGVVIAAVGQHGRLEVPMPAGSDALVGRDELVGATAAAGFTGVRAKPVGGVWRLPADVDLVAVYRRSTVRMATLLAQQEAPALPKIAAAVAAALQRYRQGDGIDLPLRAFLISGRRPG